MAEEIEILDFTSDDIPAAISLFEIAYADMAVPPDEQKWFITDLKGAFANPKNKLTFFKMEKDSRLISFAAVEELAFTRGAWALRWGTTHPDFQRQGLMSRFVDYRVQYAEQHTSTTGSVHIMARSPGIYLKKGFGVLYERGPENRASYMFKVINQ